MTRKRKSRTTRKDGRGPAQTERAMLVTLHDIAIGKSSEGRRPITVREQIMAAKTLAAFKKLSLGARRIGAVPQAHSGGASDVSLADLVADQERRAEQRRSERET